MNSNLDRDNCSVSHEVCEKGMGRKRMSWSAIMVGALVGIGVGFLLNLFAFAIGVTAFVHAPNAPITLAVGGFIALLIIAVVSMGSLGWVAGYLGGKNSIFYGDSCCNIGCLYGFTAWCFALILTVFLSAHVGRFTSNSITALSNPPYVVQTASNEVAVTKPVSAASDQRVVSAVVTEEDAAKAVATTAFASFVIFFVGALAASFAGHCAFACCMKDRKVVIDKKVVPTQKL